MQPPHPPAPGKASKRLHAIPGQILVRVHEEAIRPAMGARPLRLRPSDAARLPEALSAPLRYLRENAGLQEIRPLFSTRRRGLRRLRAQAATYQELALLSSVYDAESDDLRGINLLELDPKKTTPRLLRRLSGAEPVAFAERMPARWLATASADPMQNLQWGLRAIDWFEAGRPDACQVTVGILDSGIDSRHPDLQGTVATYEHRGLKSQDVIGHGTHVAGIIAALTNNAVGISGIANCRLACWKIFADTPAYGDFYVDGERYLQALNRALKEGVRVVNLSIGGTASSHTEELLFSRLAANGITVVAAMGNEYGMGNPVEYPAAYDAVIAVGAMAENRSRASFSNTGIHIDVLAPGANILSTLPRRISPYRQDKMYAAWSGTSMAAPHVSAAAALIAARFPDIDPPGIRTRLRATATRLPAMGRRRLTAACGSGLSNLKRALDEAPAC